LFIVVFLSFKLTTWNNQLEFVPSLISPLLYHKCHVSPNCEIRLRRHGIEAARDHIPTQLTLTSLFLRNRMKYQTHAPWKRRLQNECVSYHSEEWSGNGSCITYSRYVISMSSVTHHNERHAFRRDIAWESCSLLPQCSVWFRNRTSLGNPTLYILARKVLHNTRELNYFYRIRPR
jgi:hypothetical protein